MYFSDTPSPWSDNQKTGVIRACTQLRKSGIRSVFLSPIYLYLYDGTGGAYSSKNTIAYKMSNIDDPNTFYAVTLHELTHIIDLRSNNLSLSPLWLKVSNWKCANMHDINSCDHVCRQTDEKAFYCDSTKIETLPSRYGTPEYDPAHTDVSVNPSEDFAEASRYFIEANDI